MSTVSEQRKKYGEYVLISATALERNDRCFHKTDSGEPACGQSGEFVTVTHDKAERRDSHPCPNCYDSAYTCPFCGESLPGPRAIRSHLPCDPNKGDSE